MAWYAKATGSYSRTSTEAHNNALEIANTLIGRGWTKQAVAALLGNGAGESGLNPWRWESDDVPTYSRFLSWTTEQAGSHGYGIFGFTPANKYINSSNASTYASLGYGPNFSDSPGKATDGAAQTAYFVSTVESNWSQGLHNYYYDDFQDIGVDIDNFYYLSFENFRTSRHDNGASISLAESVGAFELLYEKPADWAAAGSYFSRVENAEYWLEVLSGETPPGPDPPGPGPGYNKSGKLPFWMLVNKRRVKIYG